jgi:hypothetical protein
MNAFSRTALICLIAAGPAVAEGEADSTFIFVDLKETQARTLPTKIISKPQATCPVTQQSIDKKLYVDYQEKRIYVCSPACLAKVKKNPRKYVQKLAEMGQGVETVLFADDNKKPAKKPASRPR